MKTFVVPCAIALLFAPAASAQLSAGNVRAAQRTGTKLVDIDYDVAGVTVPVIVALEISGDGGTTWSVSATSVTGAVGNNVTPGSDLRITWDAGVDWNLQVSTQTKFRVNVTDTPLSMSLIPTGTFTMGDALDGLVDAPTHTVNLSSFYMAQNVVTKAEWDTVRTWASNNGYTDLAPGAGKFSYHPVQTVSWWDGVKYCNARSQQEGLAPVYSVGGAVMKTGNTAPAVNWVANGYRLPTEAEWEKAARGGRSGSRFPLGDSIRHQHANYISSANFAYDVSPTRGYHPTYGTGGLPYTSIAGGLFSNSYGLNDMAGNVWQWCWDWYGTYDTATPTDPRGSVGPDLGRVIRGGSWGNTADFCRVAYRANIYPDDGDSFALGFRVARSSVSIVAVLADPSVITVDTRDKVLLSVSAFNGTVTGAGLYLIGNTANPTTTPNPGYIFTAWTGDASGTANPLEIVMDADKTIGVNFGEDLSDPDSDELTNYEELVIYGTNPNLADTDNDGLSDAWEVGIGRFSIVAGSFTWQQARDDAHTKGGELASFPSEDRWNRAAQTLGANALDSYTGVWIGLSDEVTDGGWTWANGEIFDFSNWATSRPSTTPSNTLDYVEVSGGGGAEIWKWYDRTSSTIRDSYILETGYPTDPNVADADGDGLNDSQELAAGSNPFLADTDSDGLTDGQEVNLTQTNPRLKNSDGIGPDDGEEDLDSDDLTNLQEVNQYGTNPLIADTDEDGLKDGVEVNYNGSYFKPVLGAFAYVQAVADAATQRGRVASFPGSADFSRVASKARQATTGYLWIGLSDVAAEGTWLWTDGSVSTYAHWLDGEPSGGATENHVVIMENSTQWADTVEGFVAAGYLFERVGLDPLDPDTDADGLTDGQEVNTTHSDPTLDDTDGDGLLDGAEVNTHGSSPLLADTDDDGLNDRVEVEVYHSNPSLKDSDGDGFEDLFEVNTGFDPASATSTPDALSTIRTAVEFRFNAANGVSYRIEGSTGLDNWNIVETDIIGESAVVTRFYSIENQPKRYFRVRRN